MTKATENYIRDRIREASYYAEDAGDLVGPNNYRLSSELWHIASALRNLVKEEIYIGGGRD